jgi:hypothetical protein
MVRAKLFVPMGAFFHANSGEILSPVQPKPLNTCDVPNLLFGLIMGLATEKLAAETDALASDSAAKSVMIDFMMIRPIKKLPSHDKAN